MTLRDEAEVLARAIEWGLRSVEDAVDWADRNIVALDEPPFPLIEVSTRLPRSPTAIAHHLRTMPGEPNLPVVIREIFGIMARSLTASSTAPDLIAHVLYLMSVDGVTPDEAAGWRMLYFDDALALADSGTYGDRETILRELQEFLREYSEGKP